MNDADRIRIKAEAWRDACFRHLPTIMILGGAALLVAAVFGFCSIWHPTPAPPDIQFSIDSGKATKPAFDSSHHATAQAVERVVEKIVRDTAAIARARADADRERSRADSLARAAAASRSAADSAERWRLAYEASSRDAADLRAALELAHADLTAAKDTLDRARIQMRADSARVAAQVNVEARMANTIAHSTPACTVAHFFGCPSRKAVFVGGVIIGAAGTYAWTHRSHLAGVVP